MTKVNIPIKSNTGFNGRIFLTRDEWETYLKRKPVRYIKKKHSLTCEICNKPETRENPFQCAHKIGFDIGIVYLALTPEFVDSHDNIVTAHRQLCNISAELTLVGAMSWLKARGIKSIPVFLPEEIHWIWLSGSLT